MRYRAYLIMIVFSSFQLHATELGIPSIQIPDAVIETEVVVQPVKLVVPKEKEEVLESCSRPSPEVFSALKPVLHAREHTPEKLEKVLYALHKSESSVATEAIVRLKSIYLGSWPGSANDCEIYARGKESIEYLSVPQYCLDASMVNSKLLLNHSASDIFSNKQYIIKKINQPAGSWCDFGD